ncbi:MAG: amidohydrolase family protein [Planctomycetota bacterium]
MKVSTQLLALAAAAAVAASTPTAQSVAIRAGTILTVENGRVIENGVVLVRDGRIQAVGADLEVPLGAEVVDYGPDAVLAPGLVSAYSDDQGSRSTDRAANPMLDALDGYDFYAKNYALLRGGVTSTYVVPSNGRLLSGLGAMVKTFGDTREQRIIGSGIALHGAIDKSARTTPGYWMPPIPATVDVGIGYAVEQLPKTTMGAILGLRELVALGRTGAEAPEWGLGVGPALARAMEAKLPWRISAVEEHEVRALVDFAKSAGVVVVIDKAHGAKPVAKAIAAAGVPVIYQVPAWGSDHGKDEDARWPDYSVPAALIGAGARVAISSSTPTRLLFDAQLASRGGLSPEAGLRAITLTPAELLGVSDRVGSIKAGKDADFVVLSAHPLQGGTVLATWLDGALAWAPDYEADARRAAAEKKNERISQVPYPTIVVTADEIHVGDGTIIAPGEVLLRDGKIGAVGRRVPRPAGSEVVHTSCLMPGIIDARGHLGLDGSSKVPSLDFDLKQIMAPGDLVDQRVALGGVTTVVMAPRGDSSRGAPSIAYKPAAQERQVVRSPATVQMQWADDNRLNSGKAVRSLLEKGKSYKEKWDEYHAKLAKWEPSDEEDAITEAAAESEEEEAAEDEPKDDKKKKKKKKGDPELDPDPVTGRWIADAKNGDAKFRLKLVPAEGSGDVEGNLRAPSVSDELVELTGSWNRDEKKLLASGLGSKGWVQVDATLQAIENEAKEKVWKLVGTLTAGSTSSEFTADRTSKDYPVAGRSQGRPVKPEVAKEPKGKPREPRLDPGMEPVKDILEGRRVLVVTVSRGDEIVDCVTACSEFGVKPVLYASSGLYSVASRVASKLGGVLVNSADARTEDLQARGVPLAFYSGMEEGTIDLALMAAYSVQRGMSPDGALRALTSDSAKLLKIEARVGRIAQGLDADVLALDGPPLAPGTSITRAWVNGREIVTE